jgi:hypothetical protein
MRWFGSLFLLLSCGCGPDAEVSVGDTALESDWTADFTALTDAQLEAALSAGLSRCSLFASFAFVYSDSDAAITEASPPACPTTAVQGSVVTFTGGCTADGSYTYGGVLEADNAGGLYASYLEGQDTTLNFEDYSMVDDFGSWRFDGSWTVPPEAADLRSLESVDLRCDLGSGTFGTTGSMECVAGEYGRECVFLEGMEGEVEGVGRFGLSGSFTSTEAGYDGVLTLEGAQTLIFQLSDAADGCTPYTVDGVASEHCGS